MLTEEDLPQREAKLLRYVRTVLEKVVAYFRLVHSLLNQCEQ